MSSIGPIASTVDKKYINFLIKHPIRSLNLNGKDVGIVVGTEMEGGYYINGYKVTAREEFIQYEAITHCHGVIQVEERHVIDRESGKIIKSSGFNNTKWTVDGGLYIRVNLLFKLVMSIHETTDSRTIEKLAGVTTMEIEKMTERWYATLTRKQRKQQSKGDAEMLAEFMKEMGVSNIKIVR